VNKTFVNGNLVYENAYPDKIGLFHEEIKGERLVFTGNHV